ncbi:hypothetical protein ACIGJO_00505 [Streptomyces sp. NPDC079020]|uniref:DUF7847 domain-containing protein n=1 Tax=Streptomyces sp. NPDC079020 TaxID=3365722 RepID=UPI0037CD9219
MLSGAFSTMGRYWKPLFGMGVTAFAGATLLLVAAALVAFSAVAVHWDVVTADDYWGSSSSQAPASDDWIPLAVAFGVVIIIGIVVYILAAALMQAAVPAILQQAVLGRPATFGAVWKRAWARVWAMIGTVFLTALIALVPTLLAMTAFIGMIIYFVADADGVLPMLWIGVPGTLLLVPLAIWLWVKFSLAPSIVVFEDQGPIAALRRSSQLVRGDWWRILGISLLGYVMASMAGSLLQMPFSVMGSFPGMTDTDELAPDASAGAIVAAMSGLIVLMLISQMISQLFSTIFPPLVVGLLYVDRRIRTENLGPVLAEAAVVLPEQYGPPPATP